MKLTLNDEVLAMFENDLEITFTQEDRQILKWLYKIVHSKGMPEGISIISGLELEDDISDDDQTYYGFTLKRMFKDMPKVKSYFERYKFDESYFKKFAAALMIHLYFSTGDDYLNDDMDGDTEIIFRLDEDTESILFITE